MPGYSGEPGEKVTERKPESYSLSQSELKLNKN